MRINPPSGNTQHGEKAFFAALAALNVKLEAARAGRPAYEMACAAQSSEKLLQAFLQEIRAGHRAHE